MDGCFVNVNVNNIHCHHRCVFAAATATREAVACTFNDYYYYESVHGPRC